MLSILCRTAPATPKSLFSELPRYALAVILEQEMLAELEVGSWTAVPERKLDDTAGGRLMEFTKWRRLVLPAHKHGYPERWENRTMALQSLPVYPGEKDPKPWREAVRQVCDRLGLTEERRHMYSTLQTPGGKQDAPLVPCGLMLKLCARDADFRAGVSLFRRDRSTSVRIKPPVCAITLAYADAAIQAMDAASHPHLALAKQPEVLRLKSDSATSEHVAMHTSALSTVMEEYQKAATEWARMEADGELPEDGPEREELLRETERKTAELHKRAMTLKSRVAQAERLAAEANAGAGRWEGRPPPGSRAARLATSVELLHNSVWIQEWIKAITEGLGGVIGRKSVANSTYDDRLAALDFVLGRAARDLGGAYLVPLPSGRCVTLEEWCATRLVNHDEHLVIKTPWTKEVEVAFEKMLGSVGRLLLLLVFLFFLVGLIAETSRVLHAETECTSGRVAHATGGSCHVDARACPYRPVIKAYETAFNRYNGVCARCGRAGPSATSAAAEPDLRIISCPRCRSRCWCSERCQREDAEGHGRECVARYAGSVRPHEALEGMDEDGGAAMTAAARLAGEEGAEDPPGARGRFRPLPLFGGDVSRLVMSAALIAPSAKFPDE